MYSFKTTGVLQMNINRAEFESRHVWIKYDFGYELAIKWFGQEAIDQLPKISRGKNKGRPKGLLNWIKCTKGGWVKTGPYDWELERATGYVAQKGITEQYIEIDGETVLSTPHLLKNKTSN
jgi:hypothetical protein